MFTWICPQCGREVPPAYDQCPDCSGKQAGQPQAQPGQGAPVAAAPPPPASYPPPQYAPPAQPQYAPPRQFAPSPQQYAPQPQYAPPQYASQQPYAPPAPQPQAPSYLLQQPATGISLPPWAMGVGVAVLFLAVSAALILGIKRFSGSSETSASAPAAQTSTPAPAASKQASTLQKFVEVAGMRLTEDHDKNPQVHFLVVNHSGAEISDLTANVNLWARTDKSDEETVGTFTFKLPSLGAYESKDMTAPLNTKLKVYELPDWQNLTAEIQITSP